MQIYSLQILAYVPRAKNQFFSFRKNAIKNLIEKLPEERRAVRHNWLTLQLQERFIPSKGKTAFFPLSELLYNTAAYLCFLQSMQHFLSMFPTELFTFFQILSLAELVNRLPLCRAQFHKYERKKQF